ncbi:MAG TPA: hypothetical protein VMZ27_18525 [Candidatus Saccharimonadales bacterium]|nr:hypothetical protein [Candidatus Saccharimonadales bacterium]
MNRCRTNILMNAVLLLCLAALYLWRSRANHEPSFHNHKLSFWIQGLAITGIARKGPTDEQREAVRAIGTNGIPYYLQTMGREPGKLRKAWLASLSKGMVWLRNDHSYESTPEYFTARGATVALRLLGPNADSALPQLLRYATNSPRRDLSYKAIYCLAALSPVGQRAVLSLMTNSTYRPDLRAYAAAAIGTAGSNELVIAELNQFLKLPDEEIRNEAGSALYYISTYPTGAALTSP